MTGFDPRPDDYDPSPAGRDAAAVGLLPVARHVAGKLRRMCPRVDLDDLVSECWLGVLLACRKHDRNVGGTLVGYALAGAYMYGRAYLRASARGGVRHAPLGYVFDPDVEWHPEWHPDRDRTGTDRMGRTGWDAESWELAKSRYLDPADAGLLEAWAGGETMEDLRAGLGVGSRSAVSARIRAACRTLRRRAPWLR